MKVEEITDIEAPELKIFSSLTEAQLRNGIKDVEHGLFIAESPKVIKTAIQRGYIPHALLCEKKHITGDASEIISMCDEISKDIPLYTGEREILATLTGYVLTRGVLCAMERKPLPEVSEVTWGASTICVLHGITDTTNIGAIFRSASALGVDGMILSSDTCDPLNRRAVRVSMGTVLTIPWTFDPTPVKTLRNQGFVTAALALKDNSISLDSPLLKSEEKIAVIFGTEGDGLPDEVIAEADLTVRIPMFHGVDSLNVAAAAAVTFWELRK